MSRKLLVGLCGGLLVCALGAAVSEQVTREEFAALSARVKGLEIRCAALEAARQAAQPAASPAAPAAVVPPTTETVTWLKVAQWQGQGDNLPALHPITTQSAWRIRWSTKGKYALTVWAGTPAQRQPRDMQQVVKGDGTAEGVTEVLQGPGHWNLLLSCPRGQYFDVLVEQAVERQGQ